jgi:hypothetical protein
MPWGMAVRGEQRDDDLRERVSYFKGTGISVDRSIIDFCFVKMRDCNFF